MEGHGKGNPSLGLGDGNLISAPHGGPSHLESPAGAISYVINHDVKPSELASLYDNSGLLRPRDAATISRMIDNANLIIAARANRRLIGIIRAFTDFSHACHVSDFAVERKYLRMGVGERMLQIIREAVGGKVVIFFMSSSEFDSFHSGMGLQKEEHVWSILGKDCFVSANGAKKS